MTITTSEDAIKAAASVARDVADGKLAVAELERQAVAELSELVGTVTGPDDPVWPLQVQIARGVLAAGGIAATEFLEWAAVERHRAGEPVSPPDPQPEPEALADLEPPEPEPIAPELADAKTAAEPEPEPPAVELVEQPAPPRRADGYDPLAHWPPSRSLRRPL